MLTLNVEQENTSALSMVGDEYLEQTESVLGEKWKGYTSGRIRLNCTNKMGEIFTDITPTGFSSNSVCTMYTRYDPKVATAVIIPSEILVSYDSNVFLLEVEAENSPKTENLEEIDDWLYGCLKSVYEVSEECSNENWDGYGANPVTRKTYYEAMRLVQILPSRIPKPEILAEPSGEIGLEWYKNKYSVFVISVGGEGVITYAGLFGEGNKTHGTEKFTSQLPENILANIKRVFP